MIFLSPEAVADIERLREFLSEKNPDAARRALDAIWRAFEMLETFPELGRPIEDGEIRQIVVRFGAIGYIARYTGLSRSEILILRIWHGREAR
jgi:toxin ParE1/3/4